MARPRVSLEQRFWPKVDIRGPDDCWEWQGVRNSQGYGHIRAGGAAGGMVLAHRVAWELAYGSISEGMFVLHECDNRPCVNTAHLFVGTQGDNIRDAVAKGRLLGRPQSAIVGEKNPRARLSEQQAREILEKHATGRYTHAELGLIYGVARRTITHIVNRRTWKHISLK